MKTKKPVTATATISQHPSENLAMRNARAERYQSDRTAIDPTTEILNSDDRESAYNEGVQERVLPGGLRVEQPEADNLTERGTLRDENYDRDSYDFGKVPIDVQGDAACVSPTTEDPLVAACVSEYTSNSSKGLEE
jgi:hypothetical protein